MVRIRGSIDDWLIDLVLKPDIEDWCQLMQHVLPPPLGEPQATMTRAPALAAPMDRLRQITRDLLRGNGRVEGSQLLVEPGTPSGNAGVAKQPLVRLRYDTRTKVEAVGGAQVLAWLED